MAVEPMTGSASSSQNSEAPDTVDHGSEGEARTDARVLLMSRDKAGVRQRSFAEPSQRFQRDLLGGLGTFPYGSS